MNNQQDVENHLVILIKTCIEEEDKIESLRISLSNLNDFSIASVFLKLSNTDSVGVIELKNIIYSENSESGDFIFFRLIKQYSTSLKLGLPHIKKIFWPSTDNNIRMKALKRLTSPISNETWCKAVSLINTEFLMQKKLESIRLNLFNTNYKVFQAFELLSNGKPLIEFNDLQSFLSTHSYNLDHEKFDTLLRRVLHTVGNSIKYKDFFDFVTPFCTCSPTKPQEAQVPEPMRSPTPPSNLIKTIESSDLSQSLVPPIKSPSKPSSLTLIKSQSYKLSSPIFQQVQITELESSYLKTFNLTENLLYLLSQIKLEETEKECLSLYNCITTEYINSVLKTQFNAEEVYQIFCPLDPEFKLKLKCSTSHKPTEKTCFIVKSIFCTFQEILRVVQEIRVYSESSLALIRNQNGVLIDKARLLSYLGKCKITETDRTLIVHRLGLFE